MPFRHYSSGASVFALAVAGVLSLFSRSKRPCRRCIKNDYASVEKILTAKEGEMSETVEVSVVDRSKAAKTLRCHLGTEVSFSIKDESLYVVVNGQSIGSVRFGSGSKVYDKVRHNLSYEAYIVNRDIEASGFYDFFTVRVFY